MAVGAVYLERVMLVAVGVAVILGIAYLLLRPVIKNYRSGHAHGTPPPSPSSGAGSNLH